MKRISCVNCSSHMRGELPLQNQTSQYTDNSLQSFFASLCINIVPKKSYYCIITLRTYCIVTPKTICTS